MKKTILYTIAHIVIAYWVYLSVFSTDINFLLFARIAGVFALLDYVLGLLFSIRHPILEKFMPYDKRMVEHRFWQLTATIFAILHYVFLLLQYADTPSILRMYVLPSALEFILGGLALLAFILMTVGAVIELLPYSVWRLTHMVGALFSLTAILHVFWVNSTYTELLYLNWLVYLLSLVAVISLMLSWVFRVYLKRRYLYQVTDTKLLGHDVIYLTLTPLNHKVKYKGGQFAFFSFNANDLERSPHPFTIASGPNRSGKVAIAVKALGDFTRKLMNVKPGTLVEVDGPYGKFYQGFKNVKKEVWIGAGIGITPFLALPIDRPVILYYLTRSDNDAYFLPWLKKRAKKSGILKIVHHRSQVEGRFRPEMLAKYLYDKSTLFRVCGPRGLLDSIYDYFLLQNATKRLVYEEFNFKG